MGKRSNCPSQSPDLPKGKKGGEKLILDGKKVPIPPELSKFLQDEGYVALTLTNRRGQVKIVGVDGIQIDPCGRIEGTTITGICGGRELNAKTIAGLSPQIIAALSAQTINEISVLAANGCGQCTGGQTSTGSLVRVHGRGRPNKKYKCPCHPDPGKPDPPHPTEDNACPDLRRPLPCEHESKNMLTLKVGFDLIQFQ